MNVEGLPDEVHKQNREAFKRLVQQGSVTPYLVAEQSPVDEADFKVVSEGASAWRSICRESAPKCLRLSWDDADNKRETRRMRLAFQAFSRTILDAPQYLLRKLRRNEGSIPAADEYKGFAERLRRVSDLADEVASKDVDDDGLPKSFMTREAIYKSFIVAEGSEIPAGAYDKEKPFAADLKLLFDLKYNINLSDFLGCKALTPIDTPSRSLIADLELRSKANGTPVAVDAVTFVESTKKLRQQVFAATQSGLTFEAFREFDMATIEQVRLTPEWAGYIQALRKLVCNPAAYVEDGVKSVYDSYIRMLTVASRLHASRRVGVTEKRWLPRINLSCEIGTATISVFLLEAGGPILYRIAGEAMNLAASRAASATFSFATNELIGARVEKKLGNSVDFIRTRLPDAQKQFVEVKRLLETDAAFEEMPETAENTQVKEATFNEPVPMIF